MAQTYEAARRELEQEYGELLEQQTGGLSWQEAQEEYPWTPEGFKRFAREQCGVEVLTEKQLEVARSVLDNRKTVARGAHATGKDHIAHLIALFAAVHGRRVVVTSFVERQVKIVGFGLIRRFLLASDLDAQLYTTALWFDRDQGVGIIGYTSSEASGVTGIHHDRGTFVVLSECQGIPDDVWGGLLANATGRDDKVLAVGNPISPSGMFYRVSKSDSWQAIKIPAHSHPNLRDDTDVYIKGAIDQEWVEDTISFYGRDHDYTQPRVFAEFPETSEHGLNRVSDIEAAHERHRKGDMLFEAYQAGEEPVIGLDVGVTGDRSVAAVRRGNVLEKFVTFPRGDEMATARKCIEVAKDAGLERDRGYHGFRSHGRIVVDAVGHGHGVYARLKEEGWPAVKFKSSYSAYDSEKFANARAEGYWNLRERLRDGAIALPADEDLQEDLLATGWRPDAKDKVILERKKDIKTKLGGRSPDKADSAVMAFYPWAKARGGGAALIAGI